MVPGHILLLTTGGLFDITKVWKCLACSGKGDLTWLGSAVCKRCGGQPSWKGRLGQGPGDQVRTRTGFCRQ